MNAQSAAQKLPPEYERAGNIVTLQLKTGTLRLELCSDAMARVLFYSGTLQLHPQPWIVKTTWPAVEFTVRPDGTGDLTIATARMRIVVEGASGALVFQNANGRMLVRESAIPEPRVLTPAVVNGEDTHHASAYFDLSQDEALYGLGQHQTGLLNQRGLDVLLMQDNTNIAVPFVLSSRGYGVLWNNASVGRFENHFQPKLALRAEVADAVDYYFVYGPEFDKVIASYRILTGAAPMPPRWALGFWQSKLRYSSQDEMLAVAARYRELKIPLDGLILDFNWWTRMGSHVFANGKTDSEHDFGPSYFPDPQAMLAKLHEMHVHSMISVWPLFEPGSANFDELLRKKLFLTGGRTDTNMYFPGSRVYDPFKPEGRSTYWRQLQSAVFEKGMDAWWLDSSEPLDFYGEEQGPMLEGAQTGLGSGSRYANAYPLMHTQGIYQGQRAATDKQRVFILTRSAFLGQQRYSAAAWSGDIAPTFDSLRRQIAAGLNYSLSGLPYWTTDIGGFQGGDPDDPAYRELFVRWFQYGTFCPIFRTHGNRKSNELWSYGPEAQAILTQYDELRYRLLPYIYSLAWMTANSGYTPMRALVMDFPGDSRVLDVADQFLYGPAMMVAPVVRARATQRSVYLPAGTTWYDFWTGRQLEGGHTINADTSLAKIPLFARAGSIIALGPKVQYTGEKPADPLELRVYPGTDGRFELYEDDGLTYAYETGRHATVTFLWNDKTRTLQIGTRQGDFVGMLQKRAIHVVLVRTNHGAGIGGTVAPDRLIEYSGQSTTLSF